MNHQSPSGHPPNRTLFWSIILASIVIVLVMFGASMVYQIQGGQAQATVAAAPTMTAEVLEFHYEKGLGYINLGRWTEAKTELELIFETDPNYKDVQSRLVEVYAKIAELSPPFTPTPTPQPVSATVTPLPNNTNRADGLIAYYPFEGNANDESGNGNHGKIYGAILVEDRFGNPESAYYFDGVDDRIEIANSSSLKLDSGNFSIAGWFKTSYVHDDSNGKALVDKYPQQGRPWTIRLQPDGTIRFLSDESVYSNTAVNDDSWHHFVALRSMSTLQLFIDGHLQGTALSNSTASNSMLLCVGCIHDYSLRRLFQGTIDDIRIYNRALTEAELLSLINEGGQEN